MCEEVFFVDNSSIPAVRRAGEYLEIIFGEGKLHPFPLTSELEVFKSESGETLGFRVFLSKVTNFPETREEYEDSFR